MNSKLLPSPEFLATIGAIAGTVAVLVKKFLGRKSPKPKAEYITRAEFHQGLDATRDRIGASYLALADKLDANHKEVLGGLERQGANFERRLDQLESNLARLDERTKF
jgi:hypothetical protein